MEHVICASFSAAGHTTTVNFFGKHSGAAAMDASQETQILLFPLQNFNIAALS
jgi:hypothetical protein